MRPKVHYAHPCRGLKKRDDENKPDETSSSENSRDGRGITLTDS